MKKTTQRIAKCKPQQKSTYKDSGFCHFEPLQKAKNPKKFKTHFKFKAKNLYFKGVNSHFKFMDTSLRSV